MCFFVTKFRFMVVCGHVKLGDAYGFPKKKKKLVIWIAFILRKKKYLGTIKRETIEILVPIRDHFSNQ